MALEKRRLFGRSWRSNPDDGRKEAVEESGEERRVK